MSEQLARWLLDYKRSVSTERYDKVLFAMAEPDFKVEILYTNETGFWEWWLKVAGTDYWLCTTESEETARQLCADMGWQVAE